MPPVLGSWSLSHQTTGEVPKRPFQGENVVQKSEGTRRQISAPRLVNSLSEGSAWGSKWLFWDLRPPVQHLMVKGRGYQRRLDGTPGWRALH